MNARSLTARITAAVVIAGTSVALAAGTASAKGKDMQWLPDNVNLGNLWMYCNGNSGTYDEGPGWATCTLPGGQLVYCGNDGQPCSISTKVVVVTKPVIVAPPAAMRP